MLQHLQSSSSVHRQMVRCRLHVCLPLSDVVVYPKVYSRILLLATGMAMPVPMAAARAHPPSTKEKQ